MVEKQPGKTAHQLATPDADTSAPHPSATEIHELITRHIPMRELPPNLKDTLIDKILGEVKATTWHKGVDKLETQD